ncbi:hypothetical protein F5Y04DRAFT_10564 [Hypomontagnella monticulosa]|nr:hypothetical protein F5Y04DRAFT_10564 [Hypomontagnella monticulosa]
MQLPMLLTRLSSVALDLERQIGASRDQEFGITWKDDDEKLSTTRADSHYNRKLWLMLCDIMKTTPYDLFTWGLRIGGDEDEIIRGLCELLPHPCWNGEVDFLRFALEIVIFRRLPFHLRPFGPIIRMCFRGPANKFCLELAGAERSKRTIELTAAFTGERVDWRYRWFMDQVDKTMSKFSTIGPPPELFPWLRYFVLEQRDIRTIRECLDATQKKKIFKKTTDAYYIDYLQQSEAIDLRAPQHIVKRCEKFSILNRRRARALGRPDIPIGLALQPFDPSPNIAPLRSPFEYGVTYDLEGHSVERLNPLLSPADIKAEPDED